MKRFVSVTFSQGLAVQRLKLDESFCRQYLTISLLTVNAKQLSDIS